MVAIDLSISTGLDSHLTARYPKPEKDSEAKDMFDPCGFFFFYAEGAGDACDKVMC